MSVKPFYWDFHGLYHEGELIIPRHDAWMTAIRLMDFTARKEAGEGCMKRLNKLCICT